MAMKARELKRLLEEFGFEWTTASGGGAHFKIKREGQRTVPISLHHGMSDEVSDLILKKLAKQLGLSADAFSCQ